jgi:hypothetical protein
MHGIYYSFFSILNQFRHYTIVSRCFIVLCFLMRYSISSHVDMLTSLSSSSASSSITLFHVLVSSWLFSFLSLSFSSSSFSSPFSVLNSSLKYSSHHRNILSSSLIISPSLFLQPVLVGWNPFFKLLIALLNFLLSFWSLHLSFHSFLFVLLTYSIHFPP